MGELDQGLAAQLPEAVAQQGARALIDAQYRAAQRGVHDTDRGLFEGLAKQLLALHRILEDAVRFRRQFLGAEKFFDDFRVLAEQRHLDIAEAAYLRVHRAQRPDGLPVAGEQRNSHIGANVRRGGYPRAVLEARIRRRIENDEGPPL